MPMVLGITWRSITRLRLAPMAVAASMKRLSLSTSASLRTRRMKRGTFTRAMAKMMLRRLLPVSATMANASTSSGNDWNMSRPRMIRSDQRDLFEATRPTGMPTAIDSSVPARAIGRSRRAEANTRENTSKPKRSVPNQNSPSGD